MLVFQQKGEFIMNNPLFQNILPEDIPVMLKRLNAYTKSYQKEEYIGGFHRNH